MCTTLWVMLLAACDGQSSRSHGQAGSDTAVTSTPASSHTAATTTTDMTTQDEDTYTPPTSPGAPADTSVSNTEPTVINVQIMPDLEHVHHAIITLSSWPTKLICTTDSDPKELHRKELEDPIGSIGGLLANTRYDCTATSDRGTGMASFTTGPLPKSIPIMTSEGAPAWGAYTLVSHWLAGPGQRSSKAVIYDPAGRPRWYHIWEDNPRAGIEASLQADGSVFGVGGQSLQPSILEPDGLTLRWQGPPGEKGKQYHHDGIVRADGSIAALRQAPNLDATKDWTGFAIDVFDPSTDALLWQYDSQEAVDRGIISSRPGHSDPWHPNALEWVPDDPAGSSFWVSLGKVNALVRIDTKTGMLTDVINAEAYTLLDRDGHPDPKQAWFRGQHDLHIDYPRLYLYDNRGLRDQSRVVEYRIDTAEKTLQIIDEWTEEGWYEPHYGSVDELPGGRWLIGRGHSYQDGPEGDVSQVMEVDRSTRAVVHRLLMPVEVDSIYRATRLDGCAAFANAAYCDTL